MGYSPRFAQALQDAANLHATQCRKGTDTPYIAHLLAVTAIAIEHGATEDEAIAALLHDAVEDQGGKETLRLIRDRYGDNVANIVDGCSDADETPKPPWRQRKDAYVAHLGQASPSVRLVAAADKLHNARDVLASYRELGENLWPRFSGGRAGTLWFYRAVTDALRGAARPEETHLIALIAELDAAVSTLEREASVGRPEA